MRFSWELLNCNTSFSLLLRVKLTITTIVSYNGLAANQWWNSSITRTCIARPQCVKKFTVWMRSPFVTVRLYTTAWYIEPHYNRNTSHRAYIIVSWPNPIQWLTIPRSHHQMETFSALLALCAGNSPVYGEFPHKGQWRGALMFSLICAWINRLVNNHEAGDLRRHRAHYNISVVSYVRFCFDDKVK